MAQNTPAIIVVEDEPDILVLLQRVLRDLQLEYDIIAVSNASSALAHATHRPCALLITDYMLDGMNGLNLAREFKTRYQTPTIMVTAYESPEVSSAADAAGIDKFLTKPFFVNELEAAVRRILSNR